MKKNERSKNGDMQPEYDFSAMKNGTRGKYYQQYRKGTNVVLLEPDVAEAFPSENAVNKTLRGILGTARAVRRTGRLSKRSVRATPKNKTRGRP
jgi:hypothetical protein